MVFSYDWGEVKVYSKGVIWQLTHHPQDLGSSILEIICALIYTEFHIKSRGSSGVLFGTHIVGH